MRKSLNINRYTIICYPLKEFIKIYVILKIYIIFCNNINKTYNITTKVYTIYIYVYMENILTT